LATLADRLELGGRVHFTGIRPDGPRLHQLFDVSVLCSLSEGVPNTLLEAMAQAVPVVATDVGGTRDLVSDGTTGLLVPPAQPERLAAALDSLLADPARARAMALAAQRYVQDHFSAARVIASLETLYSTLVRSA
jgi:glycosyltransferase involved in cell wall biosynthesis